VNISDLEVIKGSNNTYQVRFIQDYQSDNYKDQVRKTLHFVKAGNSWKIRREQSDAI